MSWLFITRITEIKIAYNMSAAWFLEIIWQMQRRNIFTLQQIQKIKQQCKTEAKMLLNSNKIILKLSEHWIIDSKKLLLHNLTVYVFSSIAVRKKLMKIHHDNSYTNYFKIEKITNFLWKKYYWQKFLKNVKNYVKTCNVCQYMKILHYKFYNEFILFFIFQKIWNFITMNFIMSLFSSNQQSQTYNIIFVIINHYIKIMRYFSTIFNINTLKLTEFFINTILKNYSSSIFLITNCRFLFISNYWSSFCYQLKIKWKFSTVFHFQINN